MTEITTNHIAAPATSFVSCKSFMPRFAIKASLAAIPLAIGHAFSMAFATPYQGGKRSGSVGSGVDLNGRDPSW